MSLTISYDVTVEDATAFALYHHRHSPMLRGRHRALRLGLTLVFAIFAATVGGLLDSKPVAATGLVLAILFWFLFPQRYVRGLRSNVRRMYGEGKNLGVLGPTTLRIEDEYLLEETPSREVRTRWPAVERVVETEAHVFIYISGSSALIVPKRSLDPGAQALLLQELRSRVTQPSGAPSPPRRRSPGR